MMVDMKHNFGNLTKTEITSVDPKKTTDVLADESIPSYTQPDPYTYIHGYINRVIDSEIKPLQRELEFYKSNYNDLKDNYKDLLSKQSELQGKFSTLEKYAIWIIVSLLSIIITGIKVYFTDISPSIEFVKHQQTNIIKSTNQQIDQK